MCELYDDTHDKVLGNARAIVHETELPVAWSAGIVAADTLGIIRLVALSISDAEAIERLLIARSHPDTHANREHIFFLIRKFFTSGRHESYNSTFQRDPPLGRVGMSRYENEEQCAIAREKGIFTAGLDETASFDEDEKRRTNTRRVYRSFHCILHAKHFLINPRNMQFRATGARRCAARGPPPALASNAMSIKACSERLLRPHLISSLLRYRVSSGLHFRHGDDRTPQPAALSR
ncbi:hypothetical protein DBV15_02652 [Temnothorax longispinosus]|uniref:Uncharacterized protein n=1 Tax=Temnothorax longispinosus TaxID=300112 RepID=A0A4S2KAH8_9HYME|nr:hypothetical protein DBV15_02652 [Temnothorax longispinosus]